MSCGTLAGNGWAAVSTLYQAEWIDEKRKCRRRGNWSGLRVTDRFGNPCFQKPRSIQFLTIAAYGRLLGAAHRQLHNTIVSAPEQVRDQVRNLSHMQRLRTRAG